MLKNQGTNKKKDGIRLHLFQSRAAYKGRLKSETVAMAVENRDTLDKNLWNDVRWGQVSLVATISGGEKRGAFGDGLVDEDSTGGAERGGQQA